MLTGLYAFLAHWALMTLVLWITSHVFKGVTYSGAGALWVAALLLGLVNAVVRPILIVLTLPLTLITLGLFLLVINALMVLATGRLSESWNLGFTVSGFWAAFFGGLVVGLVSVVLSLGIGNKPKSSRQSSAGSLQ